MINKGISYKKGFNDGYRMAIADAIEKLDKELEDYEVIYESDVFFAEGMAMGREIVDTLSNSNADIKL